MSSFSTHFSTLSLKVSLVFVLLRRSPWAHCEKWLPLSEATRLTDFFMPDLVAIKSSVRGEHSFRSTIKNLDEDVAFPERESETLADRFHLAGSARQYMS